MERFPQEKPVVYVETSVFSYLTARKSRNAIIAGRQVATRTWWNDRRADFTLVASDAVIQEAARGDPAAARKRLRMIEELDRVDFPAEEVTELAERIVGEGSLPPKAADDATHAAIAAVIGADYLCSWNFRHLLNPAIRPDIERICREQGLRPATICTPEELLYL